MIAVEYTRHIEKKQKQSNPPIFILLFPQMKSEAMFENETTTTGLP